MSISSFIFTYLKDKLPGINWNLGSTIRELIATPVVSVAEAANAVLNNQTNAVSVKSLMASPEEYQESINTIFDELELTHRNTSISTGTVTIMTTSDKPSAVLQNTVFYNGEQSVIVTDDTYPVTINGNSANTHLTQIGENSYIFEVPVSANGINTYLPIDTELTWDEAPDDIYNITISKAISGGRSEFTIDEKVHQIKDYVAPSVISLSDGIAKTLRNALPDIVVDACYASDSLSSVSNYANTVTENGINKSYLYVKTAKAPGYEYIEVQATQEGNRYIIDTKILGIIGLIAVYDDNGNICDITQLQIDNNDIYCVLYTNRVVSSRFTLKVYRLADVDKVQDFLNGYTMGSPFHIEVKAPTVFDLILDFCYSGQELSNQDYNMLCNTVQDMGLNEAVTDARLTNLLSKVGAKLENTGTYALCLYNGNCYRQQYSTALYYQDNSTCYAIYLGVTNIHAEYI